METLLTTAVNRPNIRYDLATRDVSPSTQLVEPFDSASSLKANVMLARFKVKNKVFLVFVFSFSGV